MRNNYILVGIIAFLSLASQLNGQILLINKKNSTLKPVWSLNGRPCERPYWQFVQICEGQKFRVVDSFYTKSGTYTNLTRTADGCDSSITTFLTLLPAQRTDTTATLCFGKCFKVGTKCYAQAGNYLDTLRTRFGCDSIIKLKLTILKLDSTQQSPIICAEESITVGIHIYSISGNYRDTVPDANGCLRIIKTNLTVRNQVMSTQFLRTCKGNSVTVGRSTYDETGVYSDTLRTITGCDSIVVTALRVLETAKLNTDSTICSGKSVLFGGVLRTATGVYKQVFRAANGCDSIISLNLIVIPPVTISKIITLCAGQDTLVDGRRFNQTTLIKEAFKSVDGCDSLVKILNITVLSPMERVIDSTLCRNQTNLVSGTYRNTYRVAAGCDSMVTINLTVKDTFSIQNNQEICMGDSLKVGKKYYKMAGKYLDLLQSIGGCDSLVFTTLKILPPLSSTPPPQTICKGDSLKVGKKYYKTAGVYIDKLTSSKGCDSTVTTTLKLIDIPELSLPQGLKALFCSDSLALNPKGDTASKYAWQWQKLPCTTCRNPKIQPILTTTYYVTVTDKTTNCRAKDSVKVLVEGTYLEKIPNAFTPNGDNLNEVFNIVPDDCVKSVLHLQIFSRWGNLLYDKTNLLPRLNEGWNGLFKGEPLGADVYVYRMEIQFTDGTSKKVSGEVYLMH